MSLEDSRTECPQPIRDGTRLQIGAAYDIAEIQQHLGNTGHAGTADADEVHVTGSAHALVHGRASAASRQATASFLAASSSA